MTGAELKRIRLSLGLSQSQMGRELGYTGTIQSLKTSVYRLEDSLRDIPFERAYRAKELMKMERETDYETEVIDRAIEADIEDGVEPAPRKVYLAEIREH